MTDDEKIAMVEDLLCDRALSVGDIQRAFDRVDAYAAEVEADYAWFMRALDNGEDSAS